MLDEESFTQLLSAAYVMQEHQRQVTPRVAPADLNQILTQIVETQHQIRSRQLPTSTALDIIVDRLQKLAGAAGAAIGVLENDEVHYKAASGTAAFLAGCHMGSSASLAAQCLNTGEVLRRVQARTDRSLDVVLRERLRAQSLLAVPVYLEGKIAGAIELYFSEANAFGEGDVSACELMAGLITEVLTQALQTELKQELAAERASVLTALEKLKPQLQKLASEPDSFAATTKNSNHTSSVQTEVCRACGNSFVGNETYCGECGASRTSGKYPGSELQSKWATLWERQVSKGEMSLDRAPTFRKAAAGASGSDSQTSGETAQQQADVSWELGSSNWPAEEEPEESVTPAEREENTALARWPAEVQALPAEPEEWSETPAQPEGEWRIEAILREHAGDIALGMAGLILLVAVIWGLSAQRSSPSAPANATQGTAQARAVKHKQRPKQPQLTLLERTLVSLGLAEPPPAPEDFGNPDAKVWVDLNTAVYYCQGDNLYGTTPKGKYTSQFDAQQDAFQPAYRKVCE